MFSYSIRYVLLHILVQSMQGKIQKTQARAAE